MGKIYEFELLTPCFCHGADTNVCEMRIPSIRGQLRKWHTILYGQEDTNNVWGVAIKENIVTSKVVLKIMPVDRKTLQESVAPQQVLPHASCRPKDFKKDAITPGSKYKLMLSFRPRTSAEDQKKVDNVINTWLYLGCVGMRNTRAFGSVWPLNSNLGLDDFKKVVELPKKKLSIVVSGPCNTPKMADCTDTLSGGINERIFGYVKGRNRLTSPLKMKYIKLNNGYHLLLYAKSKDIVFDALKQLAGANKPLGKISFNEL